MTTILTDAEKSALQFLEEFGGWMIYYENQKSDIASNVNATIPSLQTFKSLQNLNIVEIKESNLIPNYGIVHTITLKPTPNNIHNKRYFC